MQKLKISELKKVESSNLDLIGFDGDKTFVQFKNGKLYEYPNTTKEEFDTLVNADSVGKQFFKSYKKKEEFNLLENTTLEQKVLSLLERIDKDIYFHIRSGQHDIVGAIKLLKAALIDNTKAKKPIKEEEVATKYFKSLQKQQEEYLKLGADTTNVAFELKVIEPYTPKMPKAMSDADVKAAVEQYVGDKGYTQADMGSIMRYMRNTLGNQNGKAIAKFVKEKLTTGD